MYVDIINVCRDNLIRNAGINLTEVNHAFDYFQKNGKVENTKVFVEYFTKLIGILKGLDNKNTTELVMVEGKGWRYRQTPLSSAIYIHREPRNIKLYLFDDIYSCIRNTRYNKRTSIAEKRKKKFLESLTPYQMRQMKILEWGPYCQNDYWGRE